MDRVNSPDFINLSQSMNLNRAAKLCLPVLLILALAACGERQWPPQELTRVLAASWQGYRQQFISPDGRVVIPERGGGTISEAQAYALLRAVWAGDDATFGRVYAWTYQNLARPDHLLSWHWGRRNDGAWGVLDANTASDGDLDYALALVLAARRGWRAPPGQPDYLAEARQVAASILTQEVAALPDGTLILTPGNWHEAGPPYLLNPSYFSPAAYRLFRRIFAAKRIVEQPPSAVFHQTGGPSVAPVPHRLNVHESSIAYACGFEIPPAPLFQRGGQSPPLKKGDLGGFEVFQAKPAITNYSYSEANRYELAAFQVGPLLSTSPLRGEGRGGGGIIGAVQEASAWGRLGQDTYPLLARLSRGLAGKPGVGLFPDWCRIGAQGRFSPAPERDSQFGWEAARLPWRLALDSRWFQEPRAAQVLRERFLPFFKKEWQARGRLAAVYNYDGTPAVTYESPVIYAGVLAAALAAGDREFAAQLAQKIQGFYQEKDGRAYFVSPDNYYANNWAWLGLALYAGWVKP
jgi:endo-1,4-beta-D-glucanase Y